MSILDAFSILLIYNPRARLILIRPFELFIAVIVITVFCLFIVELTKIDAPVGQVFKGFLPSRGIFVGAGYANNLHTNLDMKILTISRQALPKQCYCRGQPHAS